MGSFKLHSYSAPFSSSLASFSSLSSLSAQYPFIVLSSLLRPRRHIHFSFSLPFLCSPINSLMSLDHYPILTDRRFQPSERSSYDAISLTPPSQWNYPSRSQNEISHDYATNPSPWNVNLLNNWSTEVIPSPSPVPSAASYSSSAPNLRSSASGAYTNHYAYPDHPHRNLPPTSSPSITASLSSSFERATQHRSPSMSSTFKFDDASWAHTMYTVNGRNTPSHSLPPPTISTPPSARASSRASSSRSSPVKLESDEGSNDCFVMEFASSAPAAQDSASLAPPTEVPLRATQASKAMRKMMGVFRLNPFSMHEGGGQAITWIGEEAGPLEEEPQIFEFQLDIGYRESEEEGEERASWQLQTLVEVPEPELDENTRWAEGEELELSYPPVSTLTINESAYSPFTLPSLRSYTSHPNSPSLSSASSRKTPSASEVCLLTVTMIVL